MKAAIITAVALLPWIMLGGYLAMGMTVADAFKYAGNLTMMLWPVACLLVLLAFKEARK